MTGDHAPEPITALVPSGEGRQFVFYGDSCSGVAGALHEQTFARVNSVVSRLEPPPEFIIYPGDEVMGLVRDETELRRQWDYWLNTEMAWLDRASIPIYHSTGNHTTYSVMSERVFADVLDHLPRNGAPGQEGLSYFIRRGDLLLVFVHTLSQAMGGEGHVETAWLDETLEANGDARWKFVIGHHPAFPVNGYEGPYQRTIGDDHVAMFWDILTRHGVFAYLCSHILVFDVQVHDGVLQILTAGAGTAARMPEDIEYLHCVQAALDENGLRYQVIDDSGNVRERLHWPLRLPPSDTWRPIDEGQSQTRLKGLQDAASKTPAICAFRISGRTSRRTGYPQTFVSAFDAKTGAEPFWLGVTGKSQRLTAIIQPSRINSPHLWFGPELGPARDFDIQIVFHGGMGPGGLLWREGDDAPWSSLEHRSPWGMEKIDWPGVWRTGHGPAPDDRPFSGSGLLVRYVLLGI